MTSRLNLVFATLGLSILSQCSAHAQTEPGRFLYLEDQSIVLQPAARVADDTTEMSWSPDSTRLLTFNSHSRPIDAGEDQATSEFTVVRWVRGNHAASTLYSMRVPGKMDLTYHCQWLPTTNTGILYVTWEEPVPPLGANNPGAKQPVYHCAILWIDVRRGSVKQIEIGPRTLLFVSPSKALAVLYNVPKFASQDRPILTSIRPDGTPGESVEFAANQAVGRVRWSADGKQLAFSLSLLGEGKKVLSSAPSYYDPVTGEVGKLSELPAQSEPAIKQPKLQVAQPVRHLTEIETSAKVHPLWVSTAVKSEHPRLLACADADLGVLSPDGSAVAYRSQGSAWVSELKSIPLAQFKQMLIQAQRDSAMQSGKDVALAVLMWAMDNNEILPHQGDLANITPYIGDPADMNGFNLLYGGGPIANVASPAETILGTIDAPGGVVDIYIDGHVKWRGN